MPKVSHSALRRNFRELLAAPLCVETASVFDPMSARIAADLGFEVGILGGSVDSLQVLAAPTIEDTLLPAQFGRKSTDLISIEEGIGKVRAALEARVDPELSIIARTNAAVLPTEAVIERTLAYEKAGADGICMVGISDFEHLEQIAEKLTVPLMLVTYGNPKLNDSQRLASLGVRIVVAGHGAYFAAIKATYDSLRAQRQLTHSTSNLSATELTHTYTLPESYVAWAKEFMDVEE